MESEILVLIFDVDCREMLEMCLHKIAPLFYDVEIARCLNEYFECLSEKG